MQDAMSTASSVDEGNLATLMNEQKSKQKLKNSESRVKQMVESGPNTAADLDGLGPGAKQVAAEAHRRIKAVNTGSGMSYAPKQTVEHWKMLVDHYKDEAGQGPPAAAVTGVAAPIVTMRDARERAKTEAASATKVTRSRRSEPKQQRTRAAAPVGAARTRPSAPKGSGMSASASAPTVIPMPQGRGRIQPISEAPVPITGLVKPSRAPARDFKPPPSQTQLQRRRVQKHASRFFRDVSPTKGHDGFTMKSSTARANAYNHLSSAGMQSLLPSAVGSLPVPGTQ